MNAIFLTMIALQLDVLVLLVIFCYKQYVHPLASFSDCHIENVIIVGVLYVPLDYCCHHVQNVEC